MMAHEANKGYETGPSLFPSPPFTPPTQLGKIKITGVRPLMDAKCPGSSRGYKAQQAVSSSRLPGALSETVI